MYWKHNISFVSDTRKDCKLFRNLGENMCQKVWFKLNFQMKSFPGKWYFFKYSLLIYFVNYLLNYTISRSLIKLWQNFLLKVKFRSELLCFGANVTIDKSYTIYNSFLFKIKVCKFFPGILISIYVIITISKKEVCW